VAPGVPTSEQSRETLDGYVGSGGGSAAFAALHSARRWLAWRTEPGGGRRIKVPYSARGRNGRGSTTKPETWGTLAEAAARAGRLPAINGLPAGVGIVLGGGDAPAVGGVDLDSCLAADGTLAPWAAAIVDRLDAYAEVSPSRTGLKLFFIYDPDQLPVLRTTLGIDPAKGGRKWAWSGDDHPPGIEVYLAKRYFAVTGLHWHGTPKTVGSVASDELGWLAEKAVPGFLAAEPAGGASAGGPPPGGGRQPTGAGGRAAVRPRDGSRSSAAFSLARRLRRDGQVGSVEELRATLLADPKTADWCREKGDAHGQRELKRLWENADPGREEDDHRPGREAAREAQVLKQLIDSTDVYHDSAETGFADVEINGHRATYPIKSGAFHRYVRAHAYRQTGRAPSAEAIKRAIDTIEARATIDGSKREVCRRIGRTPDAVYLDLGDNTWRAVEVDAAGWRIVETPPVRFRRHEGMLPLPEPVRGGNVEELSTLFNVKEDDFILAIGWLLGALRGAGPYPLLVVSGEQGSAKSTFCRLLVGLIDPNAVPLRALPRSDHDLYIAARNAHALCFDNVSTLAPWLSDTLCRLATGGGFAARELYTDASEVLFRGMNPIVLNGIEDFVERADLADRAIKLELHSIPDDERRPEGEIDAEYERLRPRVLGALLDGVSAALRHLHETKLDELPRMADFALWVAAGERALWQPGRCMSAYAENQDQTQVDLMEADTVATKIEKFMRDFPPEREWRGTMEQLLENLNNIADLKVTQDPRWPKSPRAMGGRLKRAQPILRRLGVDVLEPMNSNGRRLIRMRRKLLPGEQGNMLTPEQEAAYAADAAVYQRRDYEF
jgi:hypothetical protein